MIRTFHKPHLVFLLCFWLSTLGWSQQTETRAEAADLVSLIGIAESRFEVKFSYADRDLSDITVRWDQAGSLSGFIQAIQEQTALYVEKLSDRYYTLSIPATLDICG
ncbi:MAG: TonB-dependent receptor, partial [Robiginitalea sp.]